MTVTAANALAALALAHAARLNVQACVRAMSHSMKKGAAYNFFDQLDKDVVAPWASYLMRQLAWGNDNEIQEACYQLESRLIELKEKIVIEVLKNGTV